MKLKDFYDCIKQCVENAGDLDPDIEFLWKDHKNNKSYVFKAANITAMSIVPDVSVDLDLILTVEGGVIRD